MGEQDWGLNEGVMGIDEGVYCVEQDWGLDPDA